MFTAGDGGEDRAARAVVSVALDHAGEVLIGQPFSELQGEAQWHSAGLGESTAGRCEYYERGTLPEGVAMMVQDGDVVRFDLAPPTIPARWCCSWAVRPSSGHATRAGLPAVAQGRFHATLW